MKLIVLDTNVIISARLSPGGAPATLVMEYVLTGRVQLATCPSVIQEYLEVAHRSKFARFQFPPPWLEELIEESLQSSDPEPWPLALPDRADAVFLALAHASGAWLVTGNLKHFPKSARCGVTVISPAEYLGDLEKER
jgi:putative PIN family toxin of toxin-antitoxin system